MKLLENLALVLLIVVVQAWCAGLAFGLLRLVQVVGLEADTVIGRAVCLVAALAGVALGLWTLSLTWNRLRRK